MLELCPESRLPAFGWRVACFPTRGTIIPGDMALGGTATLGCAAPVPCNIVASTVLEAGLSSASEAVDSGLRSKPSGISTYEKIGLKVPLESTLDENTKRGAAGWNLAFRNAHQANRFRMIFLYQEQKQLFWNDILAKKGGGTPCHKVLL